MKTSSLKEYIKADLYRNCGKTDMKSFLVHLFYSRSFKITFWMRLASFTQSNNYPIFKQLCKFKYRRVCRHYTVDIPFQTKIGKGLLLYHAYGIVINQNALIGNNVSLSHQVTIGDEKGFSPVIGSKVLISPGAKIFGNVSIGENSIVGSNAVVLKDVPDNSVAVGIPSHNIEKKNVTDSKRNYWPE